MNNTSKKTFWPYGILLSLLAIVCACVATIIFSLDYPVYEDDSFLSKYQEVDNNFNEIQQKEARFRQNFAAFLNLKQGLDKRKRPVYELKQGTREVEFFIKEIAEDRSAFNIKATLLLTRPHTNTQDEWLQTKELVLNNEIYRDKYGKDSTGLKKSFNIYSLKAALPELEKGRWQLKLRLEKSQDAIAFYDFNLFVVD